MKCDECGKIISKDEAITVFLSEPDGYPMNVHHYCSEEHYQKNKDEYGNIEEVIRPKIDLLKAITVIIQAGQDWRNGKREIRRELNDRT